MEIAKYANSVCPVQIDKTFAYGGLGVEGINTKAFFNNYYNSNALNRTH